MRGAEVCLTFRVARTDSRILHQVRASDTMSTATLDGNCHVELLHVLAVRSFRQLGSEV
jgi:hypothetical protein